MVVRGRWGDDGGGGAGVVMVVVLVCGCGGGGKRASGGEGHGLFPIGVANLFARSKYYIWDLITKGLFRSELFLTVPWVSNVLFLEFGSSSKVVVSRFVEPLKILMQGVSAIRLHVLIPLDLVQDSLSSSDTTQIEV
ncbi:hypothetical protein Tco_0683665 [Tanacetum coccineum]